MYRQGDLLIVPVSGWRFSQFARQAEDGIVQRGEATGHAHRLIDGDVMQDRGEMVLISTGRATLVHEEHETIVLPEGEYRVLRQREFTPEGERRVRD